jgi:hypothetical protein
MHLIEPQYNEYIYNYTNYICSLIKLINNENKIIHDINLGQPINNYKVNNINIDINTEHTLVKQGGRDVSPNTELSSFLYDNNKNYLIRISELERFIKCDIVIDYTIPNIINVNKSSNYLLLNKQIYIPPILFDFNPFSINRNINLLTTFYILNQPRRNQLLNTFNINGLPITNVNTCFTYQDNIDLLKNTKILINIHQTPHHDNLEELRCLPALLCGTLVIAEETPLKEYIPYNNFIIWSTYDNMLQTAEDVIQNYELYYNKIFINSNFSEVINNMKIKSYSDLKEKLIEIDNKLLLNKC